MAYVQFDSTNRRIFLRDNDGTLLASTAVNSLPAADDAMHNVKVCFEGGVLTATWEPDTAGAVCVDAVATETGDPFVYLGSDGGTVHFDSFEFKKHRNSDEPKDTGCERCECLTTCTACIDDLSPGIVKAVIPSDFDNSTVLGCEQYRGTHILSFQDLCVYGQTGAHPFVRFLQPGQIGSDSGSGVSTSTTYRLEVVITFTDLIYGTFLIVWLKDYGANRIDCLNLEDEEIPLVWISGVCCVSSSNLPAFVTSL